MKITTISVLILLFCLPAVGGDYATLNFLGFSKDGTYLAFEEYGTQDGSGFPYANLFVIEVSKNSFASAPVEVRIERETATEQQARAQAKLKAAAVLRRYRIIQGNTGTMVVSRLHTDLTLSQSGKERDPKTQRINFAEIVGSMYKQGDYDLILKRTESTPKRCEYLGEPAEIIDLNLKDNTSGKSLMLQKDSALPESRGCPMSYEMQYVYLYQDYIAVFLNTYHMGFEGPDMRYMVITGRYK